jgi:hypothetical protein
MSFTCYIYADGPDLTEIAPELRERVQGFVAPYHGKVRLVDQRTADAADGADAAAWDLGVNFEAAALSEAERKELLVFFQSLSAEFERDFSLGVLAGSRGDDLVTIAVGISLKPALEILQSPNRKR